VKGVVWSTALLLDMREKKELLPSVQFMLRLSLEFSSGNGMLVRG
jgi:hypothetical protein